MFLLTGCLQPVRTSNDGEPAPVGAVEISVILTPSGVPMVIVPGGTFLMGNNGGAEDERPAHEVRVSALAIDQFEVTQDQYAQLELPNPAHFKGLRRPVEMVRWSDAL
jgi:formylglycine-generating enzyme required for sulfatase activity